MTENPFAVLTAVVAPAILTNACTVLSLGTGNRVARVVDRRRMVDETLASLPEGSPERGMRLAELERLRHRSRLLLKALRLLYAALGGFAGSALIAVTGSAMAFYNQKVLFQALAAVGLIVGVASVAALVAASVTLVSEVRLALDSIEVEESEHAGLKAG
jgi:hypothetical protein